MTADTGPGHRIVLLGGGGHAVDLLHGIEGTPGTQAIGFLDDRSPTDRRLDRDVGWGAPHLGRIASLAELDPDIEYLIAVGYPAGRRAVWHEVRLLARPAAILVHPKADVAPWTELDKGTVVLAGARVSPGARIGEHTHVSYLAAVGHDTSVGSFSTVMPAAIVSGDVRIGNDVLIGTNATVIEGLTIGDGARVAAGAVVVRDVEPGSTVAGAPATRLRRQA